MRPTFIIYSRLPTVLFVLCAVPTCVKMLALCLQSAAGHGLKDREGVETNVTKWSGQRERHRGSAQQSSYGDQRTEKSKEIKEENNLGILVWHSELYMGFLFFPRSFIVSRMKTSNWRTSVKTRSRRWRNWALNSASMWSVVSDMLDIGFMSKVL